MAPRYEWIEGDDELSHCVTRWQTADILAVDTEFVRERTFYPRLGLVQLAVDDGEVVLVDPEAIDLGPLEHLLLDESIIKVMHACGEDLEVLYHRFQRFPRPLFDTQLAAAFAGHGYSLGYTTLVADLLDIDVPAGQTRSDWLQRPLTSDQLRYAVHDVAHLPRIHELLADELEELGRIGWVLEETERLMDRHRFLPDPAEAYLRIGAARSLTGQELAALQTLAAWREREARRRDLPRGFVVTDDALIDLARSLPTRPTELDETSLTRGARRRHGDSLLDLVSEAGDRPASTWPDPPPTPPRGGGGRSLLDDLRDIVRERAADLDIPAPSLASRREVTDLLAELADNARLEPLPRPFDGWRDEILGDAFRRRLRAARRSGVL